MSASVLEAKGVSKSFPGVQALRDVDIDLAPGEIHALIGENGAGKSTLVSILAGALRPSTGEFAVNGTRVEIESPMMARELGIAAIYQELAIQPWLSVTANVMLGNEPGIGPGRQI